MALGYLKLQDEYKRLKKDLIDERSKNKQYEKYIKNNKVKTDKLIKDIKIEIDIINNLINQYKKEV